MKEGIKVKVVASITGHEFRVGEIVTRKFLDEDCEDCVGFHSDKVGNDWYMNPEEYEIIDKRYAIDQATEACHILQSLGFSQDVQDKFSVALECAKEEFENSLLLGENQL